MFNTINGLDLRPDCRSGARGKNPAAVLNDANILISGGTGSFGRKFTEFVQSHFRPRRIIIFSRDEVKQQEMRERFPDSPGLVMRYFIGDVRDKDRLYRAFRGVDIVVHAAALKQVPAAEYNPLEVIKTNILGASNIIDAAIDCGVKKVIALSSDKAVNPVNLYGATKLCADKLFVSAGVYTGPSDTRFAVVRYGNVIGSRGSVIPKFLKRRNDGVLPITDSRMTRFWITLEQAVQFVVKSIERMRGGEIFVPKIPSMRIIDLAQAVVPECQTEMVGIRPGEKLHEQLLTEEEARQTLEFEDYYVIQPRPLLPTWDCRHLGPGRLVKEDFRYSSESNTEWLSA
ncbi:MAG: UDP-N-acetylglucosamine 4,6-dehydratase (inverting), partial [Desulfobacterales bacterium]